MSRDYLNSRQMLLTGTSFSNRRFIQRTLIPRRHPSIVLRFRYLAHARGQTPRVGELMGCCVEEPDEIRTTVYVEYSDNKEAGA